jgi:hypothetical protein
MIGGSVHGGWKPILQRVPAVKWLSGRDHSLIKFNSLLDHPRLPDESRKPNSGGTGRHNRIAYRPIAAGLRTALHAEMSEGRMSLPRKIEPEWLDQQSPDNPRAVRFRQDLRRINALTGNAGIMARALIKHWGPGKPRTLADLGAGDGTFMLSLARRLAPRWPGVHVVLLDRENFVTRDTREGFSALRWTAETVTADLFDFLQLTGGRRADVVTANLFLHHFTEEELARVFASVAQSAALFMACDPRRTAWVREMSRLLWAIGCIDVSVRDAVVSARAGFAGKELSALWPDPSWDLHEGESGPFSHCFVARRKAQATASRASCAVSEVS